MKKGEFRFMDDVPLSLKGKISNDHMGCSQNSIIDSATRYCKASLSLLWSKVVRELVENKEKIKILTILS